MEKMAEEIANQKEKAEILLVRVGVKAADMSRFIEAELEKHGPFLPTEARLGLAILRDELAALGNIYRAYRDANASRPAKDPSRQLDPVVVDPSTWVDPKAVAQLQTLAISNLTHKQREDGR
jgi:hypothetical protein